MEHLSKDNVAEIFELTINQKQLLNQDNFIQVSYILDGFIEPDILQNSWEESIRESPAMRAIFRKIKNKNLQVILKKIIIPLTWHDLRGLANEEKDSAFSKIAKLNQEPFKIEEGPLVRMAIIQMDNKMILLWTSHALCMDDFSREFVVNRWLKKAEGVQDSGCEPLPFKDYFMWEASQDGSAVKRYWTEQFHNYDLEPLYYPALDFKNKTKNANHYRNTISSDLSINIKGLMKEYGISVEAVFQTAWLLLLNIYGGEVKIQIGATVSGRSTTLAGSETIVGSLAHSLPIIMTLEPNMSVSQLLASVQKRWEELQINQVISLEMIRNYSGIPKNHNIYSTNISIRHNSNDNLNSEIISRGKEEIIELSVIVGELYEIELYHFNCSDIYYLEQIYSYYLKILSTICSQSDIKISEINVVTNEEIAMMMETLGGKNDSNQISEPLIQKVIEEQVRRSPDAIAALYKEQSISYKELNEKANQLAHWLKREGFGRNDLAAIYLERNINMLIGILAVLKAGGAYLPLDTNHPHNRLQSILQNGKVKVILTEANWQSSSLELGSKLDYGPIIYCLNKADGSSPDVSVLRTADIGNPEIINSHDDLANVFFTSGSTGQPKGAMIEHKGMLNHLYAKIDILGLNKDSVIVQNASHCFDISVWQFLAPLMVGGKLAIYDNETVSNPNLLLKLLKKDCVTVIEMVPTIMELLINTATDFQPEDRELDKLEYMISTGEGLPVSLCKKWHNIFPDVKIVNTYGATECSDDTMHEIIDNSYQYEDYAYVTLGRSIANTKHYLLDKWMRPVPLGCTGEIYISGIGVGRGYLNDIVRTDHAFLMNPFIKEKEERMYRTGDLGRYLPSGRLMFISRADSQVKVRGYRIELGEIEHALLSHDIVRQCVVIARKDEDGNNRILSYVVLNDTLNEEELVQFLKTILPEYMIPEHLTILESLPLNGNGKVDHRALPEPGIDKIRTALYVAPRNELERKLVRIWSDVLNIKEIGIDDDFFQLGGHSMKTIQVRLRIIKELGIELSIKELFDYRTIRKLSLIIEKLEMEFSETGGHTFKSITIPNAKNADYYPTSHAQKRLFFIQQLEPDSTAYNMPCVYEIYGPLNEEQLNKAFKVIINRHEGLRTKFLMYEGQPVQQVLENIEFCYPFIDLSGETNEISKQKTIDLIVQREAEACFDFNDDTMFRVRLCKISKEKYMLWMNMHHIISDQWSWDILMKELYIVYDALSRGTDPVLPDLRIQYKDYAVWQNETIERGLLIESERYWMEQFSKEIPILDLPTDSSRQSKQTYTSASVSLPLPKNIFRKVSEIAQKNEVSMFMMLLSTVSIWLSKLTNQQDIIIGTPEAGRDNIDIEGLIGFFINTLPLRIDINSDHTFKELIHHCKKQVLDAFTHHEYPFDKLVEKLNPERDVSRNPIFSIMFQYIEDLDGNKNENDIRFQPVESYNTMTNFDLSIVCLKKEDEASICIEYRSDLFELVTVQRMLKYLVNVINQVVSQPSVRVQDIELLSMEEKQIILTEFNNTDNFKHHNKTVVELFEEQSECTPSQIAVVYEDSEILYSELNERANQLARTLLAKGVGANKIVGIMAERSIEMIIGILAIQKAGGAYLPIDPEYPEERIQYMLNDSKTEILLLTRSLLNNVSFNGELIVLNDSESYHSEKTNLGLNYRMDQLAYIIYTSGSTGTPKGVMIEQSQLSSMFYAWKQEYKLGEFSINMLQWASFSFDVFTGDYIKCLLNGGKLILCPSDSRLDLERIYQLINKFEINIFESTPVLIIPLMDYIYENKLNIDFMKILVIGSDQCSVQAFNNITNRFGNSMRILNSYGVTEATIDSCYYEMKESETLKCLPIGKPLPGVNLYILNSNNNLQPIGVSGELFIGGSCVGKGYYNRLNLTSQKFVDNPFVSEGKMYKTGDLARWLPDGNIEYLGRLDNQVKIRGNRIELEEIEIALLKIKSIQDTIVVVKEDESGQKKLYAFYVSLVPLTLSMIKETLSEKLPAYMIPSYFVQLDKLPVTPNGKIDRNVLPVPQGMLQVETEYIKPRTRNEEILTLVWEEILNENEIGVLDNFFDLGGDSIKSIQVASKLSGLGYKMEIRDLFKYPTISELSEKIKLLKRNIDQKEVTGEVQLTPIQLWFFEEHSENLHHYNQSFTLFRKDGFEELIVHKVISKLIQHHDGLRTVYSHDDLGFKAFNQGVEGNCLYSLEVFDYKDRTDISQIIEIKSTQIQSNLDIFNGPLIRMGLFKCLDGDHLLIAVHHLVIDAVSWRILLEDFSRCYEQFHHHQMSDLPLKSDSFQHWAKLLNDYAKSRKIEYEREYWESIEQTPIPLLHTDYDYPNSLRKHTKTLKINLSESETNKLIKHAHRAYGTEINDLLLSSIGISIRNWADVNRILINMEGHGRESIIPDVDINRTIGWFTSEYPVIIEVGDETDIANVITKIKKDMQEIPQNGINYSILKYLSNREQNNKFVLKPEISWNYLGEMDGYDRDEISTIQLSPHSNGDSMSLEQTRECKIDIEAMILDGCMTFTLGYSEKQYDFKTMENLSVLLKKSLENLIEHCMLKLYPRTLTHDEAINKKIISPNVYESFSDKFFNVSFMETIPGAVVIIVKNGKVELKKSYGYADIEGEIPMNADKSIIKMGSISKILTVAAVMKLLEQGRISLNEDINKYISDIEIPKKVNAMLTVEHLLSYTSGFGSPDKGNEQMYNFDEKRALSLKEYIHKYVPTVIHIPGQYYNIENYSFLLLGYIVEKLIGIPFHQYVKDHLFIPLNMTSSSFILTPELINDIAVGYDIENNAIPMYDFSPADSPDGSLLSTGNDISKFMIALLGHGLYENKRILEVESIFKMFSVKTVMQPKSTHAGYGFITNFHPDHMKGDILAKAGEVLGYSSLMWLLPKDNMGVFISANSSFFNKMEFFEQFMIHYYRLEMLTK